MLVCESGPFSVWICPVIGADTRVIVSVTAGGQETRVRVEVGGKTAFEWDIVVPVAMVGS